MLGLYDKGRLQYVGHTGTGFSDALLKDVFGKLAPYFTDRCPFTPKPKAASFFMAGHGTHLNRAAEALVAIVRLGPGDWRIGCEHRNLFPLPDLDPAYRRLIEAKKRYRQCDVGKLLKWVVEYVD